MSHLGLGAETDSRDSVPFPEATARVSETHNFLRHYFESLAALWSSVTQDFFASSDFQHKIFYLLSAWFVINILIIFGTWTLYSGNITDLLTNPKFRPPKQSSNGGNNKKSKSPNEANAVTDRSTPDRSRARPRLRTPVRTRSVSSTESISRSRRSERSEGQRDRSGSNLKRKNPPNGGPFKKPSSR